MFNPSRHPKPNHCVRYPSNVPRRDDGNVLARSSPLDMLWISSRQRSDLSLYPSNDIKFPSVSRCCSSSHLTSQSRTHLFFSLAGSSLSSGKKKKIRSFFRTKRLNVTYNLPRNLCTTYSIWFDWALNDGISSVVLVLLRRRWCWYLCREQRSQSCAVVCNSFPLWTVSRDRPRVEHDTQLHEHPWWCLRSFVWSSSRVVVRQRVVELHSLLREF